MARVPGPDGDEENRSDDRFERDFVTTDAICSRLRCCDPGTSAFSTKNAAYMASGSYNDVYRVMMPLGTPSVCKKVGVVMRLSARGASSGEVVDPLTIKNNMGLLANCLIRNRVCPHFVYFMGDFDSAGFCDKVPKPKKDRPRGAHSDPSSNNVSFHEMFDDNLYKAITKGRLTDAALSSVILQVVYAVSCLQMAVPGFRHNDLSCSNVLLSFHEPKDRDLVYKWRDEEGRWRKVSSADCGVFAAVHDYDLSHADAVIRECHGVRDVSLVNRVIHSGGFSSRTDSAVHICARDDRSFDSHFFLNTLRAACRRSGNNLPVAAYIERTFGLTDQSPKFSGEVTPALYPTNLLTRHLVQLFKATGVKVQSCGDRPRAVFAWPEVPGDPRMFRIPPERPVDVWSRVSIMTKSELVQIASDLGIRAPCSWDRRKLVLLVQSEVLRTCRSSIAELDASNEFGRCLDKEWLSEARGCLLGAAVRAAPARCGVVRDALDYLDKVQPLLTRLSVQA
jgi:hypothetical protein